MVLLILNVNLFYTCISSLYLKILKLTPLNNNTYAICYPFNSNSYTKVNTSLTNGVVFHSYTCFIQSYSIFQEEGVESEVVKKIFPGMCLLTFFHIFRYIIGHFCHKAISIISNDPFLVMQVVQLVSGQNTSLQFWRQIVRVYSQHHKDVMV